MGYFKTLFEFDDFVKYANLKTQDVTVNLPRGAKATIKAAILNGLKALHELVPHIWSFKAAIQGQNWTDIVHKTLFANTLQGNIRMRWNTASTALNEAGVINNFDQSIQALITTYIPNNHDIKYDIIEYLRQYKKPRNLDVISFLMYMQNINASVAWFPGEAANLNEADFKYAFFQAMPEKWKIQFNNANLRVPTMDLTSLANYFQMLEYASEQDVNTSKGNGHAQANKKGKRKVHDSDGETHGNNDKKSQKKISSW